MLLWCDSHIDLKLFRDKHTVAATVKVSFEHLNLPKGCEKAMLRQVLETRKNLRRFQVLFLRNDACQHVEVHEVKQVDFIEVLDHLEHGESVFITSKASQKLNAPKGKGKTNQPAKTRLVEAFYLDHV